MKRNRHGFTLMEMLVVITIIGVLAALLLNVVHGVRKRALLTTCKGNLVTFSQDIDLYKVNWDRDFPFYLSNLTSKLVEELGTPENYVCPSDWSDGKHGGVPDKVKSGGASFMTSQQFKETDDTESNTTYKKYRNTIVKECSYLYEFCIAPCSLGDALPNETWLKYKQRQMKEGYNDKYTGGHVPIVRCFWHITQMRDGSGYLKEKRVLNIGVGERAVFSSTSKWEEDL